MVIPPSDSVASGSGPSSAAVGPSVAALPSSPSLPKLPPVPPSVAALMRSPANLKALVPTPAPPPPEGPVEPLSGDASLTWSLKLGDYSPEVAPKVILEVSQLNPEVLSRSLEFFDHNCPPHPALLSRELPTEPQLFTSPEDPLHAAEVAAAMGAHVEIAAYASAQWMRWAAAAGIRPSPGQGRDMLWSYLVPYYSVEWQLLCAPSGESREREAVLRVVASLLRVHLRGEVPLARLSGLSVLCGTKEDWLLERKVVSSKSGRVRCTVASVWVGGRPYDLRRRQDVENLFSAAT
eukprot:RCo019863